MQANRLIDLHSHSTASDGELAPSDLVAVAATRGITTLALTDHDTVAGIPEAREAARSHGLELLPGLEFTCKCAGTVTHLLGLGVDPENSELLELCTDIQGRRRRRFDEMVARLKSTGIDVEVPEFAPNIALARPVLARLLIEAGHAETYDEAFRKYLRQGRAGFVPHRTVKITRALSAIHAAGGLASVAHPGIYRNGDEIVREAARLGADAVECWHSDHNPQRTQHFKDLAAETGLLATGGADFHGPTHARSVNFGKIVCPVEEYERLCEALESRVSS